MVNGDNSLLNVMIFMIVTYGFSIMLFIMTDDKVGVWTLVALFIYFTIQAIVLYGKPQSTQESRYVCEDPEFTVRELSQRGLKTAIGSWKEERDDERH